MLLAEILALSEDTGFCFAGNPHFAEWLECSPQNISKHIRELKEMGALGITFENQITGEGRKMYVRKEFYYGPNPLTPGLAPLTPGLAPLTPGLAEIELKANEKENTYIAPKKIETIDEAEALIKAWINEGNLETVKSWYDQSKKHYDRSEFLIQLTKFCSNYLNTSDKGRHFNFVTDPVKFFINGFRSWILTTDSFTRNQTNTNQPKQEVYKPLSNVIG